MIDAGSALADAIEARLAAWVERAITQRCEENLGHVPPEVSRLAVAAGKAAVAHAVPRLRSLLAAEVDAQHTTPLAIVRSAVPYATAVLDSAGVPPPARDGFAVERFADDTYDLTPANLAALGEEVGDLAVVWGATKAWEHKRRHGG